MKPFPEVGVNACDIYRIKDSVRLDVSRLLQTSSLKEAAT